MKNKNRNKNKKHKAEKTKAETLQKAGEPEVENKDDSNLGPVSALLSYVIIYSILSVFGKDLRDMLNFLFGTGVIALFAALIMFVAGWAYLMKYIYEALLPREISKCACHKKPKKHKQHESESIDTNNVESDSSEEKIQELKKE